MAKYMYDLPKGTPPFPVFGLGPQFDGFRWLAMWNNEDQLYEVGLGHGHPDREPWLAVYTYAKTPFQRSPHGGGRGPIGYSDAFSRALWYLARMQGADTPEARTAAAGLAAALLGEADWSDPFRDGMHRPRSLGETWKVGTITVDGHERPADRRDLHDHFAILVDLPTVAIAITGPSDLIGLATPIVDVRGSLDVYV